MAKLFDRVGQVTATTGAGTVTLGAVITDATNGDLATFADMGAVATDVVNYLIVDGNNWEIGAGTLGGTGPGFTLTRTVAKSKISGTVGTTALTLSGSAKVYSVPANAVGNTWAAIQTSPAKWKTYDTFYANNGASDTIAVQLGSDYANDGGLQIQRKDGTFVLRYDPTNGMRIMGGLGIGATLGSTATDDTLLWRDAAATLALKNSTNAQTFRVYGSDGGANYSRLSISHAGGTAGATIATEAGGTGTAGPLTLRSTGTSAILEQTGDSLGTTRLTLQNRSGLNGALFENVSVALVDFAFKGSGGTQANFRCEQRTGQFSNVLNTSYEFQFGSMYAGDTISGTGAVYFQISDTKLTRTSQGNFKIESALGDGNLAVAKLYLSTSADTALARNAAGIVEINNGTAGAFRDLKFRTLLAQASTTTAPNMNFASGVAPTTPATGDLWFDGTDLQFRKTGSTVALSGGGGGSVAPLVLGTNLVSQVNSTNAQTFNVYGSSDNTGVPTTNYSRLAIKHLGGTAGATIATEAGGTGSKGPLTLNGDGSTNLTLDNNNGVTLQYGSGSKIFFGGDIVLTQSSVTSLYLTNNRVSIPGATVFSWGSSIANSTIDIGFARNAAGIVEVNSGSTGSFAAIRAAAFEQAQGTLTSGATIAWDVRAKQSATLTLATTGVLSNPTNLVAGTTYMLIVKQDATGSRVLTYGTVYKFPGGTAPVLSTAANAVDILTFVSDGTNMYGVAQKAFA